MTFTEGKGVCAHRRCCLRQVIPPSYLHPPLRRLSVRLPLLYYPLLCGVVTVTSPNVYLCLSVHPSLDGLGFSSILIHGRHSMPYILRIVTIPPFVNH